jgi:Calcineurin-like phosphoesterase
MNEKYDIVGDIHGYADKLQRLLRRLGYEERDGIYRHASRQLVFVGDFIDRGPEIRRTLQIARAMVEAGTARAVMGNHEFNALLYHTIGPDGEWLRAHTEKNTAQHRATLDEIALPNPAEWEDWMDWMLRLPLWMDLGSCRVVHAAWDDSKVRTLETQNTLKKASLAKVGNRRTREGKAVDFLLKGPEYKLRNGTVVVDKDGHIRTSLRAKWWIPIRPGMPHAEAAMPAGEIRGEGYVPDGVSASPSGNLRPAIHSEYEDELRPILRFTMVVYLYMVFETRVSGDVSQIERIRQGNRAILKDIKTEEKCGIVKAAKIYFRNHANLDFFADEGWRQLEEIACVRHCIVHNAGVPRDSNQCDTIRALANRTWGQGQAVGLRIEDLDRPMTIDQPFLQYCLSMLEDFFKRLGIAAENKFRK